MELATMKFRKQKGTHSLMLTEAVFAAKWDVFYSKIANVGWLNAHLF